MVNLWLMLVQFIVRLTIGMAVAILLISPRRVSHDFFRLKAWIVMGLSTVACLAIAGKKTAFTGSAIDQDVMLWLAISITVCSYITSVFWLYSKPTAARFGLAAGGIGAFAIAISIESALSGWVWGTAEVMTSACLLGGTLTTMLLGHWHLNAPQMDLKPIQRLVAFLAVALVFRGSLSIIGQISGLWAIDPNTPTAFLVLRWLAGLLLPAAMCIMVWFTLKVPNTQSATGILYAILILVFLGELVAQLAGMTNVATT